MGKVSKRLLLGVLGAATSFGMVLGGKAVVDSVDNRATEVAAADSFAGKYAKITQTSELEDDAKYLLVYEKSKYAFDGNSDNITSTGNYFSYSLDSDGSIITSQNTEAGYFTLVKSATSGKYLLKAANGEYVYNTSTKNGIKTGTESSANQYPLGITFNSSGNCQITYSSTTLQFFDQKGSDTFKFYKSTQQPICLYKYEAGVAVDPESVTISLDGNLIEESITVYDGQCVTFETSVLPEGADQDVAWTDYMSDDGSVLFMDGELITEGTLTEDLTFDITAKSAVLDTVSKTISVTVKANWVESLSYEGQAKEQVIGEPFDSTGLSIFAHNADFQLDVTEDVIYVPEIIEEGITSVTASYMGKSVSIPFETVQVNWHYKATDITQLYDGATIVLGVVDKTHNIVAGSYDSGNGWYTSAETVTIGDDGAIDFEQTFTLGVSEKGYTIYDNATKKYLAHNASNGKVNLSSELSAKTYWDIYFQGQSLKIKDTTASAVWFLQINSSAKRIGEYKPSSNQTDPYIYVLNGNNVAASDKLTTFAKLYLRWGDELDGSDTGACRGENGYYAKAKAALQGEWSCVSGALAVDTTGILARIQAWAIANGEVFEVGANGISTHSFGNKATGMDNPALIAISCLSLAACAAMIGYAISRRKIRSR